jgi:hypothetical protein
MQFDVRAQLRCAVVLLCQRTAFMLTCLPDYATTTCCAYNTAQQQLSERSGYSIAVALLARLAGDATLQESVPDTLELLLRACLEALQLALKRAPSQRSAATNTTNTTNTGTGTDNAEVTAARAVLAAALSVCAAASTTTTATAASATASVTAAVSGESQLQHNWLLETVARVARKMEHEWHSLLFPLHFAALDSNTDTTASATGAAVCGTGNDSSSELEGAYPTHLFHASLVQGKLITAAWFLPLIE